VRRGARVSGWEESAHRKSARAINTHTRTEARTWPLVMEYMRGAPMSTFDSFVSAGQRPLSQHHTLHSRTRSLNIALHCVLCAAESNLWVPFSDSALCVHVGAWHEQRVS
jgi:hypothetical protein